MTTKGCISYTVINGTIQLFMARSTIPIVSPASGEIHLQIFQQRLPPTSPTGALFCVDLFHSGYRTAVKKKQGKHKLEIRSLIGLPVKCGFPDDFQFLFSSIKQTHQTYSQFSSIVGFRIG